MATDPEHVSALNRSSLSAKEDWENLVSWDEEFYDPLFQGDMSFTGPNYGESFTGTYYGESFTGTYCTESFTTEHNIPESARSEATSIIEGNEGNSSTGHMNSWLSTSPSLSTTATSPGRNVEAHQESFNARDPAYSPLTAAEFPILDTRQPLLPQSCDYQKSFRTASPFNAYIPSSPRNVSGLDVSVSFALTSNMGSWIDQSHIEPILELDHAEEMSIPHISFQGLSDTSSSIPWPNSQEQPLARAITIPQPNRRTNSYNPAPTHWAQQTQSPLSVSPESKRRPRALSRGTSRSEPRRTAPRNSLTTPSPTSNAFGWIAYQPDYETNRLMPSGTELKFGRRHRGRTKGLTAEQRKNAAIMRVIGSCNNCKKRKEKCDPGTPCKSCLEHYKGDLINSPCRDRLLSNLSRAFLSDRLGWHPTARALESFISPNSFNISNGITYIIPLNFGFGPVLHLPVHALQKEDPNVLYHDHLVYSWPPTSSPGSMHTNAVLPAVLTTEAVAALPETLDMHLSLLVTHHFRAFPLYVSNLRILRELYVFYRSLPTSSSSSRLLHQALKLLVLVHIGGDLTLPAPATSANLAQLVRTTMPEDVQEVTPAPCFIRSQLGSIMPSLTQNLMNDVLSSLELLLLNRECSDWPLALAVLLVVLMTVESIQYHAAKVAYHHSYDTNSALDNPGETDDDHTVDDADIEALLSFYSACFSGCHIRLHPNWEGEATSTTTRHSNSATTMRVPSHPLGMRPEDKFVESVREAAKRADPGYLEARATAKREGEDMGFFFDRLVARVLVLGT